MKLSKFEKVVYVGTPWFFGVVGSVCGSIISVAKPAAPHGIVLIGTGLVCVALYCVCSLLAKLIERT